MGRVFTNDEDKPGGAPVVVLSYGLWQRRFGGQTNILNQPITLNGKTYTVIGIMPQDYLYPSRVEMWVPVGQLSDQQSWKSRGNHPGLYGVARLKPGVSFDQAVADMARVATNLEKQYPDSNCGNGIRMRPLMEIYVSDIRRALWVIFAAVGFVLVDCLCQHRQPVIGPRNGSSKRDGNSFRAWSWTLAYCASAVDRKYFAIARGWNDRSASRSSWYQA